MKQRIYWNLSLGCIVTCIVILLLLWAVFARESIASGQAAALADITVTNYLPQLLIAVAIGVFIVGVRTKEITSLYQQATIPSIMLGIGLVFSASNIFWIVTSLRNGYNLLEGTAGLLRHISLLGLLAWILTLRSKKIAGAVGSLSLAGFTIAAGCIGFLLIKHTLAAPLDVERVSHFSAMLFQNGAAAIALWTYLFFKDRVHALKPEAR